MLPLCHIVLLLLFITKTVSDIQVGKSNEELERESKLIENAEKESAKWAKKSEGQTTDGNSKKSNKLKFEKEEKSTIQRLFGYLLDVSMSLVFLTVVYTIYVNLSTLGKRVTFGIPKQNWVYGLVGRQTPKEQKEKSEDKKTDEKVPRLRQ